MEDNRTNDIHPLIELLNLERYDSLSSAENLSLFTETKKALIADNKPIKGNDGYEPSMMQALTIGDAESLWQSQTELLMIMVSTYANNVLHSLFEAMNDLSDGGSLMIEVDDLSSYNLPNLEDWLDGFNGDVDTLNAIREEWSNVIELLNIGSDLDQLEPLDDDEL